MRRGFATILVLGLVAAVFVLGGAYYLKQINKQPPVNTQPSPATNGYRQSPYASAEDCQNKTGKKCIKNLCQVSTDMPLEEQKKYTETCVTGWGPDESLSPTANWKTYTDITGKFSLEYPAGWRVLRGGSINTGTETISFGPNITGVTEDENIKVWIQMQSTTRWSDSPIKNAEDYKNLLVKGYSRNPDSNLSTTPSSVGGVNGFEVSYTDTEVRISNVIIDKNGLIYSIALRQTKPYSHQEKEEFDQILSTFKFTD